ncbi:hypothetical protein EIN43_13020 [Enterobacter hormaechei]|uniref:Uncharacterized protein n=1 Tax=Enterobacter hormaechei TaxID=158836 RepID=A0A4Y5ZNZ3_9ENTR|nr:hypothetical protein EIN43_13020 [Enterobacter hormaechei]
MTNEFQRQFAGNILLQAGECCKRNSGATVEHFIHYASTLRLELCVKVNSPDLVKGMGVILDEENLENVIQA